MIPVAFLPDAEADLLDIYFTIGQHNEPAAARQIDRIRMAVRRLGDFPYSAAERPEIAPGARGLVVGQYVALHRIRDDEVQIVRVMHMAQDAAKFTPDFDRN